MHGIRVDSSQQATRVYVEDAYDPDQFVLHMTPSEGRDKWGVNGVFDREAAARIVQWLMNKYGARVDLVFGGEEEAA